MSGIVGFGYSKDAATAGFETTDSTIKITAVEDLGGGLKVTGILAMEAQGRQTANVTNHDASLTLARGNFAVSMASSEVGADARKGDVSNVSNEKGFDQASYNMVTPVYDFLAASLNLGGGLTAAVSYADMSNASGTATISAAGTLGDVTATDKVTKGSLTYANGPLMAYVSYAVADGTQTVAAVAAGRKDNQTSVAASYDLGVAKVGAGFQSQGAGTASTSLVTVNVPFGAVDVGAGFVKYGSVKGFLVGGNYSFSKTTMLRVGYQSSDAASLDGSYRIKLTKSF